MQQKIYLEWENVNFLWENVNLLWEEVAILIEIGEARKRGGGGAAGFAEYMKSNPWAKAKDLLQDEEKVEKFIRLVCRINDIEYEEATRPNKNIKLKVDQIQKVVDESAKIGIKI